MKRCLPFLLLFAFAAVVIAAVLVLFGGRGRDQALLGRGAGGPGGAAAETPAEDLPARGPGREKLPPAAAAAPEEKGAMPESYRKALGALKGRVVESDGTPVSAMKVELLGMSAFDFLKDGGALLSDDPPRLEFRTGKTKTAADGTFSLADVFPRAFYALCLDRGGSRPTTRIVDHVPSPGETVDLGDIVLAPCAVLTGFVKDAAGSPVAGARVRATALPPVVFLSGMQDYREGCSFLARWSSRNFVFDPPPIFDEFACMLPFPTTATASDGSFRLEGVPLGTVTVVVDRPGFVTNKEGPLSTREGGEKDVGVIVLDEGVDLKGKVVDGFGDPVPGVEVRLGPMYGVAEFIVLQPPVFTGEKGEFLFAGAAPLATFAAARRFPENAWTVVGPFDPDLEPPTITLPPACDLRVVAFAPGGGPAKGVRLKIRQKGEFLASFFPFHPAVTPKERMERPEEGVVDVKALPPGSYDLFVTADGCGVKRETVTIEGEPVRKEIFLDRALEAVVRVITEKGKNPVSWASVRAFPESDFFFSDPLKLASARTDSSGKAVLKNLAPGTYKLGVTHPAYAYSGGVLRIPQEGETLVILRPGGILEGVVHRGGSVHEAPFMIALNFEGGGDSRDLMPRVTATDLEGKFRVTNLSPGTWNVIVMKRLLDEDPLGLMEAMKQGPLVSGEVEIWSGETSRIALDLGAKEAGPAGVVSGRVFIDGAPARGARVSLWRKRRYEAAVDDAGRYSLGAVPAGKHTLRVTNLPGAMGEADCNLSRRIEVVENVPLEEDFEIVTGSITGRLECAGDPNAARGVRVTASIQDGESGLSFTMKTVTGLDGSFSFTGVPEGTYTVSAWERRFGCPPAKGVRVYAGGRAGPVVLEMITPVPVRGRVQLPESALQGAWIGLLIEGAGDKAAGTDWVNLDRSTGEFETNRLIPGSYKARLFGGFEERYKPILFTVPAGGTTGLVLVPEKEEPGPGK